MKKGQTMPNPSIAFSFDADTVDDYTCGDCWVLAAAIKEATGLPFVAYFDKAAADWNHVANRLPDGRIVDVEGVWSAEAWVEKWDAAYWKTNTSNPVLTDWSAEDYTEYVVGSVFAYTPVEQAQTVAEEVKALLPV